MPKGEDDATRTGSTAKPNTNAEGQLDVAADPTTDPQDLVPEGFDAVRAKQAPKNEAATERPEKNSKRH